MTYAATRYFSYGELPVLGVLVVALWALIVIRLRGIKKSNVEYPSRWRTASGALIVTTGILCTTYFAMWIDLDVVNQRVFRIRNKYGISEEDLTPDTSVFTEDDLAAIARLMGNLVPVLYSMRFILTVALWMAKLAFVSSFFATAYCLSKRTRWALYATAAITVLSLGVAIWALAYDLVVAPLPDITSDAVIPARLWNGLGYMFLVPLYEYVLTGLNMGTDIIIIATACYIVRTLQVSRRAIGLLVFMIIITISIAATRIAVMVAFVELRKVALGAGSTKNRIAKTTNLSVPNVVLSEFEVILGAIVSCFPGFRAWARARWPAGPQQSSAENSGMTRSKDVDLETQSLEFPQPAMSKAESQRLGNLL